MKGNIPFFSFTFTFPIISNSGQPPLEFLTQQGGERGGDKRLLFTQIRFSFLPSHLITFLEKVPPITENCANSLLQLHPFVIKPFFFTGILHSPYSSPSNLN
ncbi:MAG: hypothetical protein C6I01_06750 [Epsilonproteobacteria bacterium]|nr:hypothetical protein [Campylobacterota bacterium]